MSDVATIEMGTNAEAQVALFLALDEAAKATSAVPKDAKGQGYMYAAAENVMREADRALSANGLVVAPVRARLVVTGEASKGGKSDRTIFSIECRFLVAHNRGGWFIGEMTLAVGANLAGTPPQATSSAYTCCERDFYRALLRMPRGPEDDVEHPKNNRAERFEDAAPARPAVAPPAARKATRVLSAIAAVKSPAEWDKAREKWDQVLFERSAEDDCGYSDAEVAEIKAALAAAATRVGA
jgi:hypothetical protein